MEEEVAATAAEVRKERNSKMTKGSTVVGMRKVALSQLVEESGGTDHEVFALVIGVDEHCRNDADVRAVMKERNILGTIYPMRNMKPVTQKEKVVTMFD